MNNKDKAWAFHNFMQRGFPETMDITAYGMSEEDKKLYAAFRAGIEYVENVYRDSGKIGLAILQNYDLVKPTEEENKKAEEFFTNNSSKQKSLPEAVADILIEKHIDLLAHPIANAIAAGVIKPFVE